VGRILIVVPTYNEIDNVPPLVRELLALRDDLDVWVADDGSPDGTGGAVKKLMKEYAPGRLDLVEGEKKRGRGAAVIASFKKGLADPRGYDILFEMDADFSHHPNEIPKFLEKLKTHDMVIGSRYIPGGGTSEWGMSRAVLSWVANKYVKVVAGIPIRDTTSGYRGYRRAVLEEANFDAIKIKGYVVHGEMAYQAYLNGFRLGEVPIHFKNRARDASKMSLEEVTMALINFAMLRFRYGFRRRKREFAN
jgi:dolichol-phosphate mannosyltransferase